MAMASVVNSIEHLSAIGKLPLIHLSWRLILDVVDKEPHGVTNIAMVYLKWAILTHEQYYWVRFYNQVNMLRGS